MELLKENLLNCILLLPAGALLPLIMNRKVKWQEALVFGVLISATIETSQLITMRGLFEWADYPPHRVVAGTFFLYTKRILF